MEDYFGIASTRLRLFAGMITAGAGMGAWCFDWNGNLYYSTCPYEKEMIQFFKISGCLDYALSNQVSYQKPVILSDSLGLVWAADYVYDKPGDKTPILLIVIGPVFSDYSSINIMENRLLRMNLSATVSSGIRQIIREIPVMTMSGFRQYASMLHFAITLDVVNGDSFEYQHQKISRQEEEECEDVNWDYGREYEEMALQRIRDGIMDDKAMLDERVNTPRLNAQQFSEEMDMREAKNLSIIHNALCSRAAIQGGVPPRIAGEVELENRKRIEGCRTISSLADVTRSFRRDYTRRVHEIKAKATVSAPIQACCDYISEHILEEIKLSQLARKVGYTEYYLTKKFLNEMGVRLSEYVKVKRIEYAKILLVSSDHTIDEICDIMNFASRSYFNRVFSQIAGQAPSAYREKTKHRLPERKG